MTNPNESRRTRRRHIVESLLFVATIAWALRPDSIYAQPAAVSEGRIIYFVLLDDSASMRKRPQNPSAISWLPKIDEVKRQMGMFMTSLPDNTEIHLFAFAKELIVGPKVRITSATDRKNLMDFVKALRAEGNETRFWRSLDTVLGEASSLAKLEPGLRVRVLAYSDLEDNERPVPTQPTAVLAKYQTLLRESGIRLTYITIGFELRAERRKLLENQGIEVRTALVPEDVIPLQAEFRVIPSEVQLGASVTVVDDSIGVIRDRVVDWGDESESSKGRSPTHIYKRSGEYTVRLTVTSSTGQKSTATQRIRVLLPPPPVAAFKVSAKRIPVAESVLLVNESKGAKFRIKWDFGDGRSSKEENPHVVWSKAGDYGIRLAVTDSFGRVSVAEQKVTVEPPKAPIAAMVVPKRVELDTPVRLIDRSSGEIDSRSWVVDGQQVSSQRDCMTSFSAVGLHEVRLTITGPGGTDTAEEHIEVVAPEAPRAAFVGPDSSDMREAVQFFDRSTGPIDHVAWYVDGALASKSRDFVRTFDAPGQHTVTLKVEGRGGKSQAERKIKVRGPKRPAADFHVPEVIIVDETVNLLDRSSGEIAERIWLVDGKPVSKLRDAAHRFTLGGNHTVRLEVRGPGGSDTAERTVEVSPIAKPTASFVFGTPAPRAREAVVLTDTSTGQIDTATWYLPGRKTPVVVQYRGLTQRSIEHVFIEPGEAEVRLQVRGRGGQHETARKLKIGSRFARPNASVTVQDAKGRGSLMAIFKNRSTGSIVRTEYDFGDGSPVLRVSGVKDVRHKYSPGHYMARVRLIGPEEFVPELVEIPIEVAKPLPAWVRHLWWALPSSIAVLGAVVYAALGWRRHVDGKHLSMLVGTLNYKPHHDPLAPYQSVQFTGSVHEERVPLNQTSQAIVRATTDPLTNLVEHSVEVVDENGSHVGPVSLAENDRTTVGEYEFNLVQT